MKAKNSMGPSTDLWGTPYDTGMLSDLTPFSKTFWDLSSKNDFIHLRVPPLIP